MKKVIFSGLFLAFAGIGVISCEKEVVILESKTNVSNDFSQDIPKNRAQGGDCEKKAIHYRTYIDCTKEGTGCKVKCDAYAADDLALENYLQGLNPLIDNTTSIKSFLHGLAYVSQSVKSIVQTASFLEVIEFNLNGQWTFGVFDANNNLIYAFSL